jgi:DNA modification methylase
MNKLIHGKCEDWNEKADCIFLDPYDNIGYKYHDFVDKRDDYIPWLCKLITKACDLSPIVWVSYNAIHDLPLKAWANDYARWHKDREIRTIIWFYTFCQYRKDDLSNGYRPILLIKRQGSGFPDNIREESERMRIGDERAAGPKIPSDVWNFPRVAGTHSERKHWHPTQHPVILYDRIMKYSCPEGGSFVDYFAGTGTCFRAGLLNPSLNITGIEQSKFYCEQLRKENALT